MNELLYVKYNNTGLQALLEGFLPNTPLSQLKRRVSSLHFSFTIRRAGIGLPLRSAISPATQEP